MDQGGLHQGARHESRDICLWSQKFHGGHRPCRSEPDPPARHQDEVLLRTGHEADEGAPVRGGFLTTLPHHTSPRRRYHPIGCFRGLPFGHPDEEGFLALQQRLVEAVEPNALGEGVEGQKVGCLHPTDHIPPP